MKRLIFALIVASFFMFGCTTPEPVKDVNGIEARYDFVKYVPEGYTNLKLIDTHWGYFDLDGHTYLLFVSNRNGYSETSTAITLVK